MGAKPFAGQRGENAMKANRLFARALVLLSASLVPLACAGVASAQITIATFPVGNPRNTADPLTDFGSVGYSYNLGEYDVTSSQYTPFLNSVAQTDTYSLYNSAMAGTNSGNPGIIQIGSSGSYTYSVAAGRGNFPVTDVTFWDTLRFTRRTTTTTKGFVSPKFLGQDHYPFWLWVV
jgi:hypothetical protein